ncbi:MAG: hypothetical protein P8183_19290 [Anaerolineae bacterium]|jgi:hypothetical protein
MENVGMAPLLELALPAPKTSAQISKANKIPALYLKKEPGRFLKRGTPLPDADLGAGLVGDITNLLYCVALGGIISVSKLAIRTRSGVY